MKGKYKKGTKKSIPVQPTLVITPQAPPKPELSDIVVNFEYVSTYSKKHRIIFFTTELNSTSEYEHFTYMIRATKELGHNVMVVTNYCDIKIMKTELKSIHVYQTGKKIPKGYNGNLHNQMHTMLSAYAALWIVNKEHFLKPTFIIVRNSNAAATLLKHTGHFHVVYYQTWCELRMLNVFDPQFERQRKFHEICINNTNEIVVQNKFSVEVFNSFYMKIDVPIRVLFPCYETEEFEECPLIPIEDIVNIPPNGVYFVTFGPLNKSSMFELAIHAFGLLLDKARVADPVFYYNLYLIVACYVEDTRYYNNYMESIQTTSLQVCLDRPCVLFVKGAPIHYRKSLLSRCEAVLHPMAESDGKIIIEAGIMKKPVIATNFGIAKELIVHNVTGFLLDRSTYSHFYCMFMVTYDRASIEERSEKIYSYFKRNYTKLRYLCELQNLIIRNSRHELE